MSELKKTVRKAEKTPSKFTYENTYPAPVNLSPAEYLQPGERIEMTPDEAALLGDENFGPYLKKVAKNK